MAYNASEYIYCTSRVRALENSLIGNEKLERLLDTGSAADVAARLGELGVGVRKKPDGKPDFEATFDEMQEKAYDVINRDVPDRHVYDFMRVRYDSMNLKAALKCKVRAIDPYGMFVPCGIVPYDKIAYAVDKNEYDGIPGELADAAREAFDGVSKTGNPQLIDMIIDRACYRLMHTMAKKTGVKLFVRMIESEADLLNAIMTLRIFRLSGCGEAAHGMLSKSLLDAGKISTEKFGQALDGGEDAVVELLDKYGYSEVAARIGHNKKSFYLIEKYADDFKMELLRETKFKIDGAEPCAAYVITAEYIIKNLRIIAAGKNAGLDSAKIRERMRICYV